MSISRTFVEQFKHQTGGTISALRAIVDAQGFIDSESQIIVADVFNISRAEVRGIVSFYTDLRTTQPADKVIRVCHGEACQASGCRELTSALEDRLQVRMGETSADNAVALEHVFCLGYCAQGPTAEVDGQLQTGIDPQNPDALIAGECRAGIEPQTRLEEQTRLIFSRYGKTDPLDIDAFRHRHRIPSGPAWLRGPAGGQKH